MYYLYIPIILRISSISRLPQCTMAVWILGFHNYCTSACNPSFLTAWTLRRSGDEAPLSETLGARSEKELQTEIQKDSKWSKNPRY